MVDRSQKVYSQLGSLPEISVPQIHKPIPRGAKYVPWAEYPLGPFEAMLCSMGKHTSRGVGA